MFWFIMFLVVALFEVLIVGLAKLDVWKDRAHVPGWEKKWHAAKRLIVNLPVMLIILIFVAYIRGFDFWLLLGLGLGMPALSWLGQKVFYNWS